MPIMLAQHTPTNFHSIIQVNKDTWLPTFINPTALNTFGEKTSSNYQELGNVVLENNKTLIDGTNADVVVEAVIGGLWYKIKISLVDDLNGYRMSVFEIDAYKKQQEKDQETIRDQELLLWEQREIVSAMAATMPVGSWTLDVNGDVVRTNDQLEYLLGSPSEETVGTPFSALFHDDDKETIETHIAIATNGNAGTVSARYYRNNFKGEVETRWCDVTYKPIMNGVCWGIVGVIVDTTSKREVLPQIQKMRDEILLLKQG